MLKSKEFIPLEPNDKQNKLDLFYCIVFLISYLSIQALINGNHFIWAAFTRKTAATI